MAQEQIQAGAVVQLKSGGPAMTVRWKSATTAYCEWFDDGKVVGHEFEVAQLQPTTSGPQVRSLV